MIYTCNRQALPCKKAMFWMLAARITVYMAFVIISKRKAQLSSSFIQYLNLKKI